MSNDAEILLEMANANAALGRAIVELMLERDELRKRNRELQRELEPWEPQGPKYTRKEAAAWAARFGGKPVARVAHFATEGGAIAIKPVCVPRDSLKADGNVVASPTVLIFDSDVATLAGILEMAEKQLPLPQVVVTEDDGDPG